MLTASSNFNALLQLIGASGTVIKSGVGSPELAEVGNIGDYFARTDGGPGNSAYLKVSGSGTNIGWLPVGPKLEQNLTAQVTGSTSTFTLSGGAKAFHDPAIEVQMDIWLDGQRQVLGGTLDYTATESGGAGTGFDTLNFNFTPRAGSALIAAFLPL